MIRTRTQGLGIPGVLLLLLASIQRIPVCSSRKFGLILLLCEAAWALAGAQAAVTREAATGGNEAGPGLVWQGAGPQEAKTQQPARPDAQGAGEQTQAAPAEIPKPKLREAPKPVSPNRMPPPIDGCLSPPCQPAIIDWYLRFENGPQVKPLTPREKGWLATKNLIDPFNGITILGEAGISVAADPHSPVGPGMPGWGRAVGISFTEDMTGEFFGTFLIPSIVHQDPHYHRMSHATIPHRIFHAIDQVVWTQGDNGKGMVNYANLVGFAIEDEIANLYVPGRQTNLPASASRYAVGLASAPIDNFVSEFLPDVARHIHVQVVVIQRIINQVASKDNGGS
jgi:hypothetical protein